MFICAYSSKGPGSYIGCCCWEFISIVVASFDNVWKFTGCSV